MVEFCSECGAKVVEYKHGLSKGLAKGLYIVARAQEVRSPVRLMDTKLTYSQRANFIKLQYWGLIARANTNLERGGEWYITEKGFQFMRGEISLQHFVWTYRNQVQRFEGKQESITDLTGGWKYRPDYAREAVPH